MSKRSAPSRSDQQDRIDNLFSLPGARADRWREPARRRPAPGRPAGRTARAVEAALDELGAYEEFFAYPGARLLSTLRQRIATGDAEGAASLSRRISEAILTRAYKHDTGAWEAAEQLAEAPPELNPATMRHQPGHRPYFEMLVVSPGAADRGPQQVAELRRLRRPEDAFVYEGGARRQLRGRGLRHPAQPGHRLRHDLRGLRLRLPPRRPRAPRTCWPRPASTPTTSTATTWRSRSPPA